MEPVLVEITGQVTYIANKKCTLFAIQMKCDQRVWCVVKQNADFCQLIATLKTEFPSCDLKLTKKRLFNSNHIKSRIKCFSAIVNALLKSVDYREATCVKEFLKLDQIQPPKPDSDDSNSIDLGDTENKCASIHDFVLTKTIGKGNFGQVFLARSRANDQVFAIKVLDKKRTEQRKQVGHVMRERNVLVRSVRHPFLCNLRYSFQSNKKLYFVLDYVNGGELYFHLRTEGKFDEGRARFYTAEVACALGYLHSENIIYRDLKLENILLDDQGHVVLTDFGLAKENIGPNDRTDSYCGTPEYLAPEIIRKEPYATSVDWWCLGVVLYEMLHGNPPFYSEDKVTMFEGILYGTLTFSLNISPAAERILTALLQKESYNRLGSSDDFDEIRTHEFFQTLDWDALVDRRIPAPFIPFICSQSDTRHVAPEFIKEPIPQSVAASMNRMRIQQPASLTPSDGLFSGFSYNPSKR